MIKKIFNMRYFAFLLVSIALATTSVHSNEIDRDLPDFSFPVIIGAEKQTSFNREQLLDQVSVVVFFASWCIICKNEHSNILSIAKKTNAPFYGVAFKDREVKVTSWLNQNENPYHIVAIDKQAKMSKKWGLRGIPAIFIIDKKAHIRYQYSGSVDVKFYEENILPIIQKLKSE